MTRAYGEVWFGVVCVAGLCCMIAVSWYAFMVVEDFKNPFSGGVK